MFDCTVSLCLCFWFSLTPEKNVREVYSKGVELSQLHYRKVSNILQLIDIMYNANKNSNHISKIYCRGEYLR